MLKSTLYTGWGRMQSLIWRVNCLRKRFKIHWKGFYFSKVDIIPFFSRCFENDIVQVAAFASNAHIGPFKDVFGHSSQYILRNSSVDALNRHLGAVKNSLMQFTRVFRCPVTKILFIYCERWKCASSLVHATVPGRTAVRIALQASLRFAKSCGLNSCSNIIL